MKNMDIHYKINSRSAHKLFKASQDLMLELDREEMMDMSGDVNFYPIREQAFKKLYRRYGIKGWNQWCDLMHQMEVVPLRDADYSNVEDLAYNG
jgi:hypothetical protein